MNKTTRRRVRRAHRCDLASYGNGAHGAPYGM